MANRRITELQELAGLDLADQDLLTVVHVFEVDPTLKNRKLTISGTKEYLNQYYLPRTGGTVSGALVVQGDLTVSGSTNFTTATFTGAVTVGSLIAQSGVTASGTISGATITGTNVQGTNVNGVLGNFDTITGYTINVNSGNFLNRVSGTTITGASGAFTSLAGTTTTGTTANFVSGVFTTQISGATITGTTVAATTGNYTSLTGVTATITSGIFSSGLVTAPSIAIGSGTSNKPGIYSPGTDQLALVTSGVSRLQFTDAGAYGINGANYGTSGQVITSNGINAAPSWQTAVYLAGTSISVGNTSATVTDTGTDGAFTVVTEGSTNLTVNFQGTLFGRGFATPLNYYSVARGASNSSMIGHYVAGGGASNPGGPLLWSFGNGPSVDGCELTFLRTKSNTSANLGGQTLAGDGLGFINFLGTDGTSTRPCASIQAYSEIAILSTSSPGQLVFGTTTAGTTTISEKLRITNGGTIAYNQPTPTSKSAAATLTVAELQTGIIEYTGSAATLTLPTGTLTEGGFVGIYTNMAFKWSVINTGSGACTIGAGTAHTIVGSATVAIGESALFASRRTAANTFVSYRLS